MRKQSIAAIVTVSMAATLPIAAASDTKDLLIGGAIGALIHKGITDNQQKKSKPKSYSSNAGAASLNSQYSQAERVQIQTAFRDLGYNIGVIDGVLGKNSRAIIRQYQASLGQAQTGQLTRPQYVSLLSQAPGVNPVFAQRELNRDEVVMLQQGLQALGYYPGYIDGSKGPGTLNALNAFLAQNGTSPAYVTPVQSLVMVRNSAGLPTPPYLLSEAGVQVAPVQPFNTQQANQGFVAQQPNQGFVAQGQQPVVAGQGQFATAPAQQPVFNPNQQQPVAAQPATTTPFNPNAQAQPVAPAGGAAPANTQQNLFPQAAPQQQQQAPQPAAPQTGQGSTLFASGTNTAPAAAAQPQVQQSNLDIFSGTAPAQPVQPTNQVAEQAQPVTTGTLLD